MMAYLGRLLTRQQLGLAALFHKGLTLSSPIILFLIFSFTLYSHYFFFVSPPRSPYASPGDFLF